MEAKAVIFDLDGTLLDSMQVWDKVDDIFFKRRNLKKPDFYAKECSKRSFFEIARFTAELFKLPETPEQLISEWTELAAEEYAERVRLKANAGKFLEITRQRGYKSAVCTSLTKELYYGALVNNGIIDFFDVIVSAAEFGIGKQFPEIYAETARLLNVMPENCIMIDDVAESLIAAGKAGMKTAGVRERNGRVQLEEQMIKSCDLFVEVLDEKIFELFE